MVTVGLPLKLRLEFDALYRRVGYRSGTSNFFGGFAARDRGNSWEFPIIVRRTLWRGVYAGVGYAPRTIHGSSYVDSITVTDINGVNRTYSEYTLPGLWETTHGVVAAAGFEKRAGPVWVAPEVRYVHWNKPTVNLYGPARILDSVHAGSGGPDVRDPFSVKAWLLQILLEQR